MSTDKKTKTEGMEEGEPLPAGMAGDGAEGVELSVQNPPAKETGGVAMGEKLAEGGETGQELAGEPVMADGGTGEAGLVDELADGPVSDTAEEGGDEPSGEPEREATDEKQPVGINVRSVIEAVLFATDEPVTAHKLVDIVGVGNVRDIKGHIKALNQRYAEQESAFRIENIADGYLMLTLSEFNPWLSKLLKVRSESKLTPAGLETLAIIAYKQPIMRAEIENIRGVAAGEMVRQLVEKGLVKIVGRAEELGRPLLYGTTRKFLEVFGLSSLKDLPNAEDDKKRRLEAGESAGRAPGDEAAGGDAPISDGGPTAGQTRKRPAEAETAEPDILPESQDDASRMELQ